MDRYVFAAEFRPTELGGYTVTFPDLPGCVTEGSTVEEALTMARDALELHLYGMEEDGEAIPVATTPDRIVADPPSFTTLVEAWMPRVRNEMAMKAVKKTLTIPKWLNDLAEENRVNYSRILQEALKDHLEVRDRPRRR